MAKQTYTASMTFKKETPGAIQFIEDGEREDHVMGGAYIRKSVMDSVPEGGTITITVEWEDGKTSKPVSKGKQKKARKKGPKTSK